MIEKQIRSYLLIVKLQARNHPVYYEEGNTKFTPTILDIGCGYGGLLFKLSKISPDELILGFEIRDTITEYVGKKIRALRIS